MMILKRYYFLFGDFAIVKIITYTRFISKRTELKVET